MERKSGDDWVSACRDVVVAGVRGAGRGRKTWRERVKDDMDELGLDPEWVRICGGSSYRKKRLTLAECGKCGRLKKNDDDDVAVDRSGIIIIILILSNFFISRSL